MIHHGDLFDVLPTLEAESIDACVTDGPYGIGFMGREWDTFKPENVKRVRANPERDNDRYRNLYGRERSPAQSPSQMVYDYTPEGLRGFQAFTEKWAREVFRVLKPGAYILSCGAPRSHHRMMCGLEDAGFVVRDCFAWLFSSGFPKSLNFGCRCGGNAGPYSHAGVSTPKRDVRRVLDSDVSQTVDAGGEPRQVLLEGLPEQGVSQQGTEGTESESGGGEQSSLEGRQLHRAGEGLPDDPHTWSSPGQGERLRAGTHRGGGDDSGQALEADRGSAPQGPRSGEQFPGQSASLRLPSRTLDRGASERRARCETCGGLTAARGLGTALKPAHEPIAVAWKPFKGTITDNFITYGTAALDIDGCRIGDDLVGGGGGGDGFGSSWSDGSGLSKDYESNPAIGRWPANVLLDEDAAALLDAQSGVLQNGGAQVGAYDSMWGEGGAWSPKPTQWAGDLGGASRFYYVAKPSREERDLGCEGLELRQRDESRKAGNPGGENPRNRGLQPRWNFHPTVKPVELMRWLVRLVTPPNGLVLDPFMGSGTTGMACAYEQRRFIGIEREAEYVAIAERRIRAVAPLFSDEASA